MDLYGLTGGIGSGKSAVGKMLEEYGIPVISADELSRMVVAPGTDGLAAIVRSFGQEVLNSEGELDRKQMASIVFDDPSKRELLEKIVHPRVRDHLSCVLKTVEEAGHAFAFYEVPLLFETGQHHQFKSVALVTAPEEVRIRRVQKRDQSSESEVRARIQNQMPEEKKRELADYVIENDGSLDQLRQNVDRMLNELCGYVSKQAARQNTAGLPPRRKKSSPPLPPKPKAKNSRPPPAPRK